MKIYSGNTRTAVIAGPLVFKFPRLRIGRVIEYIIYALTKWKWGGFWLAMRITVQDGFQENWREACTYWATRHSVLAPCLLPLVLVNVYRRARGVGMIDRSKLLADPDGSIPVNWNGDEEYATLFSRCHHTFRHSQNLAFDGVQVQVVDYGERGMRELIGGYGDKVEQLLLSSV